MGFGQDMKEFSAGFSSGFQMGDRIKARREGREDKAEDRAFRQRQQDDLNKYRNRSLDIQNDRLQGSTQEERDALKKRLDGTDAGGKTAPLSGDIKVRGQQVVDHFVKLGYTKEAAAGIAGNLQQESNLNPSTKPGDQGSAHGIAQWRGDRWTNMQAFAAKRGTSPYDMNTQLDFIDHEISGMGKRGQQIKTAGSVGQGADMFALYYERPKGAETGNAGNIHGIGNRRSAANQHFGNYTGSAVADAGGGAGAIPPRRPRGTGGTGGTQEAGSIATAAVDAATGGGDEEAAPAQPTQVAQLEVDANIDPETGEYIGTGTQDEEAPMVAARGGAIPDRYFADAGGVDPYNRYRGYTQPITGAAGPTGGTAAKSAFKPRRVGEAMPETFIKPTALPKVAKVKPVAAVTPTGQPWDPRYGAAPAVKGYGSRQLEGLDDAKLRNWITNEAGQSAEQNFHAAQIAKAKGVPQQYSANALFGMGAAGMSPEQHKAMRSYARWRLGEDEYTGAYNTAGQNYASARAQEAPRAWQSMMSANWGGGGQGQTMDEGGPIEPQDDYEDEDMAQAIPVRRMAAGGSSTVKKPPPTTVAPKKLQGPGPGGPTYIPRGPNEVGYNLDQISPAQANARGALADLRAERMAGGDGTPHPELLGAPQTLAGGMVSNDPAVVGGFGFQPGGAPGSASWEQINAFAHPQGPRPPRQLYEEGGSVPKGKRRATVEDAKRLGVTEGDIKRSQSDPSRYGPMYVDDAPAGKKQAPTKKAAIPERKRRPAKKPVKDVTTTGSVPKKSPSPGDPGLRRPYDTPSGIPPGPQVGQEPRSDKQPPVVGVGNYGPQVGQEPFGHDKIPPNGPGDDDSGRVHGLTPSVNYPPNVAAGSGQAPSVNYPPNVAAGSGQTPTVAYPPSATTYQPRPINTPRPPAPLPPAPSAGGVPAAINAPAFRQRPGTGAEAPPAAAPPPSKPGYYQPLPIPGASGAADRPAAGSQLASLDQGGGQGFQVPGTPRGFEWRETDHGMALVPALMQSGNEDVDVAEADSDTPQLQRAAGLNRGGAIKHFARGGSEQQYDDTEQAMAVQPGPPGQMQGPSRVGPVLPGRAGRPNPFRQARETPAPSATPRTGGRSARAKSSGALPVPKRRVRKQALLKR